MRATFFLALLPLITARDFLPLRRQDTSASQSFDSEFPSSTAVPGVPKCAESCYSQAQGQTSDCPSGSIACLCTQPEVQGFIASCLQASCSMTAYNQTSDLESAAQYGIDLCKAAVASETASASAGPSTSAASSAQASTSGASSQSTDATTAASSSQGEQPSQVSVSEAAVASSVSNAASTGTPPTTIVVASTSTSRAAGAASVSSTSRSATVVRASAASSSSTGFAMPTAQAGIMGVLLAAGGVALAL